MVEAYRLELSKIDLEHIVITVVAGYGKKVQRVIVVTVLRRVLRTETSSI